MSSSRRNARIHIPVDLSAITGTRIHGDTGVTPIDTDSVEVIAAGGERWLRWTHQGIERAVNYRHIVEMFCDPSQLAPTDPTGTTVPGGG